MGDQAENIAVNLTYILERGAEGSHVLFRVDEIRHAFRAEGERGKAVRVAGAAGAGSSGGATDDEGRALVRSLAALPTIEQQRGLIDTLPDAQRDLLICLYFEFLDQYVATHGRVLQ